MCEREDRAQPGRARSAVPTGGGSLERGGKAERQQRSQNVTLLCRTEHGRGRRRADAGAEAHEGGEENGAPPQSGGNEREMERERE